MGKPCQGPGETCHDNKTRKEYTKQKNCSCWSSAQHGKGPPARLLCSFAFPESCCACAWRQAAGAASTRENRAIQSSLHNFVGMISSFVQILVALAIAECRLLRDYPYWPAIKTKNAELPLSKAVRLSVLRSAAFRPCLSTGLALSSIITAWYVFTDTPSAADNAAVQRKAKPISYSIISHFTPYTQYHVVAHKYRFAGKLQ